MKEEKKLKNSKTMLSYLQTLFHSKCIMNKQL